MSIRYSKYLPGFIFVSDVLLLNLCIHGACYMEFGTFRLQNNTLILITLINIVWLFQ